MKKTTRRSGLTVSGRTGAPIQLKATWADASGRGPRVGRATFSIQWRALVLYAGVAIVLGLGAKILALML